MIDINEIIKKAREMDCSDIHLTAGIPPILRLQGKLIPMEGAPPIAANEIEKCIKQMAEDSEFIQNGQADMDFCYVNDSMERHRVNVYRQQGTYAVAIRLLKDKIPSMMQLGLPSIMEQIAMLPRGLVLVTGPTGSGKTTTLAAMIDYINAHKNCHILTLEDPVEYLHRHKKCMVNQREVGRDINSFANGLRSALREDPDVILVGEMRDLETIAAAITAAETGHLVLSTLHTTGAASTIDRIIDVFPPYQQQQMRTQLASVLRAVISQQLVPLNENNGRIAALEILLANDAVCNLIRENKCHQISSVLQTSTKFGMQSMDMCLATYANEGIISRESAIEKCIDKAVITRILGM